MSETHWLIRPWKPKTSLIFGILVAITFAVFGLLMFLLLESDRISGYIIFAVFVTNANIWLVGTAIYWCIIVKLEEGSQ
jgi:heme/copper-type cytochrome/quinol oxidase subunit 4